jgi:tripartite ATP-independent transporter DctM subunit
MNYLIFINLGNRITKAITPVTDFLFKIGSVFIGIMAIPVFIDVSMRFVFSKSLTGANDIVEICLALITFLSIAGIQNRGGHINITFVVERLSESTRRYLDVFNFGASALLIATIALRLFVAAMGKLSIGETTFELGLPVAIIMVVSSLGLSVLAIVFFGQFLSSLGHALGAKKSLFGVGIAFLALVIFTSMPWWYKAIGLPIDKGTLGAAGMCAMIMFLLVGMPIGISMAMVGSIGLLIINPTWAGALSLIGQAPYSTSTTYILSVIPMFILMGDLASESGISRDLIRAANAWLGRLPGGLIVAALAGCAGFSAVCGESMATAVTMATVSLPEMRRAKYDLGICCGPLAAGGTLGILIPPSMGFIFYAIVTEVSVGKLFIAGIIPGIILTSIFIIIAIITAIRNPELAPRGQATTWKERFNSLKGVVVMMALITFILGGILLGFFSPNEGGAVGAVMTFLYALARRRINLKALVSALNTSMIISCKLMFILIGVGLLGYFFAMTQLPQTLATFVGGLNLSRYLILLIVVVMYAILGCVMNVIPMILLTLPALFPTILALEFDPIWFGVMIVIIMEMGQITPPVGVNVFAISSIVAEIPMATIFGRVFPYFVGMVLMLVILTLFPGLATWLPSVLF